MLKRTTHLSIMLLCLSLTISGCSLQDLLGNKKKSTAQDSQKQKSVIAVALDDNDPNKVLIKKGIDDMASKDNVQIKYLSPSGTGGQQAQGQSSQDQKSSSGQTGSSGSKGGGDDPLQGAKVLVFQGGNPEVMQSALSKKVPVLALGQVQPGSKPAAVILPNQEKVGELMAQALINKIQEGQAIILQGKPNENGTQERLAGMRQVLGKYPKISVQVIAGQPGSETLAKQALVEYIRKNPDKVQAILADSETTAAQAAEVLRQTGLDKKVLLVGGQANVLSLQRMAGGNQSGDVDVAPYLQGVNAYQWAQKLLKKEPLDVNDSVTSDQGEIPAKVLPVKAVTPENLAITQKSYTKAISMAEQAQKSQAQESAAGAKSSGSGKDSKDSGSSGSSQDKSGSSGSSNSPSGASSARIPQGASKVTEHVKTTITREYLDDKGTVLGTEQSANEQVRTVPADVIKKELEQQQQKQPAGQSGKADQKSGEKSDGGDQGKGK